MAITTLDAVAGVASGTGAGPFTGSYTLTAGSDRVMIVGVAIEDTNNADRYPTAVTYNGIALTELGWHYVGFESSAGVGVALWYLLEASLPANGTYTLSVSVNASVTNGVSAHVLVQAGHTSQTAPANYAEGGSITNGASFNLGVTANATTGRVVGIIAHNDGGQAITPTTPLVEDLEVTGLGHRCEMAHLDSPSAGSNTLNWTTGVDIGRWAAAGIYLGPNTVTATAAGTWGALTATGSATVTHPATAVGTWGALTATAAATVTHPATAAGAWGAWTATAAATVTTPAAEEDTGHSGAIVWERPRPRRFPKPDPHKLPPPLFIRHAKARAQWGGWTATATASVYAVDNDDDLLLFELL